jgi:acyl-CoA thioesterase FadM
MISTLLDETMARIFAHQDVLAFTGRLEIKFRRPVPLDQELTVVGELTRSRSRAYEARGEIRLPDGTVLVEGAGTYIRIPAEAMEQAREELEFWQVVPD